MAVSYVQIPKRESRHSFNRFNRQINNKYFCLLSLRCCLLFKRKKADAAIKDCYFGRTFTFMLNLCLFGTYSHCQCL